MYTVRYECSGRFGNCVFPYSICVIFQEVFGYIYTTEKQPDEIVINDTMFQTFYTEENFRTKQIMLPNSNLCFSGFFQYDYIFRIFKDILQKFITLHPQRISSPYNNREFTNEILYKDYLPDFIPTENDIVIHVRLEDNILPDHHALIPYHLKIKHYKTLLQEFSKHLQLSIQNIYWVMCEPKYPIEFLHLEFLLKEIGGSYTPQSMEKDLCMMRKTKNLICSGSTFSWIGAAYSIQGQNVFIPEPNTSLNHPHEKFLHLHSTSYLYPFNSYKCKLEELQNDLDSWKENENKKEKEKEKEKNPIESILI